MLKRIRPAEAPAAGENWRDLNEDVDVELTSDAPIGRSSTLCCISRIPPAGARMGPDLRASVWLGPRPVSIRRIRLVFEEHSQARTQEFVIRAATSEGVREIVRQQFTVSPRGTTVQREEYSTNLDGVRRLELAIVPAIDGGSAIATLREWRLA